MSKIEWTGKTWNVTVGCSKVSPGCQNCYAIKSAHRMAFNPNPKISSAYSGLTKKRGDRIEWTGKVNFVRDRLEPPLRTRKPTVWFMNSMSDLFHESITDEQLDQIFAVMALTPQHTYQVLTKRPERMLRYSLSRLESNKILNAVKVNFAKWCEPGTVLPSRPYQNIWLGCTVENQQTADKRIPLLLQTPAAVRFLSCEPLLERVFLRVPSNPESKSMKLLNAMGLAVPDYLPVSKEDGLHWVIVGGESGPKARPFDIGWARSIIQQCKPAGVPVFVKQLGKEVFEDWNSESAKFLGSTALTRVPVTGKGNDMSEWPEDLRVREYPRTGQGVAQ